MLLYNNKFVLNCCIFGCIVLSTSFAQTSISNSMSLSFNTNHYYTENNSSGKITLAKRLGANVAATVNGATFLDYGPPYNVWGNSELDKALDENNQTYWYSTCTTVTPTSSDLVTPKEIYINFSEPKKLSSLFWIPGYQGDAYYPTVIRIYGIFGNFEELILETSTVPFSYSGNLVQANYLSPNGGYWKRNFNNQSTPYSGVKVIITKVKSTSTYIQTSEIKIFEADAETNYYSSGYVDTKDILIPDNMSAWEKVNLEMGSPAGCNVGLKVSYDKGTNWDDVPNAIATENGITINLANNLRYVYSDKIKFKILMTTANEKITPIISNLIVYAKADLSAPSKIDVFKVNSSIYSAQHATVSWVGVQDNMGVFTYNIYYSSAPITENNKGLANTLIITNSKKEKNFYYLNIPIQTFGISNKQTYLCMSAKDRAGNESLLSPQTEFLWSADYNSGRIGFTNWVYIDYKSGTFADMIENVSIKPDDASGSIFHKNQISHNVRLNKCLDAVVISKDNDCVDFSRIVQFRWNYGSISSTVINENLLRVFAWSGTSWEYFGGSVNSANKTITVNANQLYRMALFELDQVETEGDYKHTLVWSSRVLYLNDASGNAIVSCFNLEGNSKDKISLYIYNIEGNLVKTIIEQESFSSMSFFWDGTDERNAQVPIGIYLYKLEIDNKVYTGMISLVCK